ncbi:MAG: tetratricopeptide repeat protein [Anaerolineales bacterium]|nr:tetratricopeptide repeat protein [Anaerolineales bacterium]
MHSRWLWFVIGAAFAALILLGVYQIPPVKNQLEWRMDAAASIVRGWLYPGDTLPVPASAETAVLTPFPTKTDTPIRASEDRTATSIPTPTPLPAMVRLASPQWEKQDWNNCGPATLALGLRFYGWGGDQYDISALIKPDRGDRNVNIDELAYFVRNRAGWMGVEFRVGGTLEVLKRFIAAGFPMIIEKGYVIESDGPDAGWAGHYLLLTGYDDARQIFIAQDTFQGADEEVSYQTLSEGWKAFNRVYMVLYPTERQDDIDHLLGTHIDENFNREQALESARAEVESDAQDAFAWFNLGTNLLYFERYDEAARAYDSALALGLPWRFTRYQFGPYIAYFNTGRYEDVIDLAEVTLRRTNKAEESMLWRGWARYQQGDLYGAIEDFRAALIVNPNYLDAQYALEYLGASR